MKSRIATLLRIVTLATTVATAHADRILMVGTSVDTIPGTATATGVWGEELVLPYEAFVAAGHQVELASPLGRLPVDAASHDPETVGRDLARRVKGFLLLHRSELEATRRLSEIDADSYDALFVVGGHGVMWDLADDQDLRRLTEELLSEGRALATLCHGPAFLATATDATGRPLIRGFRVTGFSDAEERAIEMQDVVPFSLEQGLSEASGGRYSSGPAFESHVVVDRHLVTGQNPASSAGVAEALLELLGEREHQGRAAAAAADHDHDPVAHVHADDTVVCRPCRGSGWLQGGPGYYRYRCSDCGGTGRAPRRPGDPIRPPTSTDH